MAGGQVQLSEGTFNTIANLAPPANAILQGRGYASLIIPAGAAITNGIVLNSYCVVRDLRIDLANGCGTGGARPNCLYANAKTNLIIEKCWIIGDETEADDGSDIRQCGVVFTGVTNSRIVDNYLQDMERHGIRSMSSASAYNRYFGNRIHSVISAGLSLYEETYSTYSENTITAAGTYGFEANGIDHSKILGNTVVGAVANGGMEINRTDYCIISHNTSNDNADDGIRVRGVNGAQADYNTLVGNVCTGNGGTGIEVTGDKGGGNDYANNNIVTGNQLNGNTGANFNDDATNTVIGSNNN